MNLVDWLEEQSAPSKVWFVKRLAANDTLASGGHQAGPYIPKDFLFRIFPSIKRRNELNPRKSFNLIFDSHDTEPEIRHREAKVIWYNNRFHGGTRNEARITNLGGGKSPLLDPDSTGDIAVLAFHLDSRGECYCCHAWVSSNLYEHDLIENWVGAVEPGSFRKFGLDEDGHPCEDSRNKSKIGWLSADEIPEDWLREKPRSLELFKMALNVLSESRDLEIGDRLLKRYECSKNVFLSWEEAAVFPKIKDMVFSSVDAFVEKAKPIVNSRKARAGYTFELNVREILVEEGFVEGTTFDHQKKSDKKKRPDFLFPNQDRYQDESFCPSKLRMLAVKTTVKERWRQILNEADRIETKHLLTLEHGVSQDQLQEMLDSRVQLVVPKPNIRRFPKEVRHNLQTLEEFFDDTKDLISE